MGRELPPAEVLAADQRITAWARELRRPLDGSMDELRARAYLDILLDKDSRPGQDAPGRQTAHGGDAAGGDGTGPNGTGDHRTVRTRRAGGVCVTSAGTQHQPG